MMRAAQQRLRALAAQAASGGSAPWGQPQQQAQQQALQQLLLLHRQAQAQQHALSDAAQRLHPWRTLRTRHGHERPRAWQQWQAHPQRLQQQWHHLQGASWWRLEARALKHSYEQANARSKKSAKDTGLYLGAVVLGMIGVSYAMVPLYRMFCQATGYGGAVGQATGIEDKLRRRAESPDAALEAKAAARELRVWFSSDVADDMPWRFTPTQEFVKVRPGQSTLVFFTAENRSDKPITGVSTYNVVPDKAAYYFNKIQCFCFEEQRLRPGEVVDMPVFFYIDPELADDFNCRNVHDITLSYTFYKVDDEDATNLDDSGGVKLHASGPIPAGITLAPGVKLPPGVGPAAPPAAASEPAGAPDGAPAGAGS